MEGNKIFTANGVSFLLIAVKGGSYTMGALDNDFDAFDWEKPAHTETIADFMIGETQVTQELWQAVMGSNPSYFTGDMQRPVECVSWDDCQTFIRKLNQLTGQNFRLPSEAEWEYAARGGNKTKGYKYSGSNDVDEVAWYRGNAGGETHPVKTKIPNELGIYGMSGNVYEWCQDYWTIDYKNGPHDSGNHLLRGGYYDSEIRRVRVADRISSAPDFRGRDQSLRLAL
jgi:formylglycine-generating enzyme required for sulfatase activity